MGGRGGGGDGQGGPLKLWESLQHHRHLAYAIVQHGLNMSSVIALALVHHADDQRRL